MLEDDSEIKSLDFDAEMRRLAATDMQQSSQPAAGASAKGKSVLDKSELKLALGEIVLPLARDVEAIKKSASESTLLLVSLGKIINSQQAIAAASAPAPPSAALDSIAQQMQRLGSVESANQKLFDALHSELKGYKDNFLFEALQKPFIRELLPFFDDLSNLHAQLEKRLEILRSRDKETETSPPPPQPRKTRLIDLPAALLSRSDPAETQAAAVTKHPDTGEGEFLKNLAGNVENHVHHMVEILLRMDVELVQTTRGLPLDKKVHRTVSFDAAPSPEDDNTIARSLKPGFSWKERMIRPEDVVTYRWRTPGDTAPLTSPAPATVRTPPPNPAG